MAEQLTVKDILRIKALLDKSEIPSLSRRVLPVPEEGSPVWEMLMESKTK